jgi:hypothetical protein
MTEWVDEILTSSGKNTGFLRTTDWVDKIVTSSDQKTVGLLVMAVIRKIFFFIISNREAV